jgi:16S rRNA processing protein RimM
LVPFFIESISFNGAKAIVAFEDLHDLAEAQSLKGKELYLPLSTLPELKGNEFYLHEILGYSLVDATNQKVVGVIDNVIESGPQLLLSVLMDNEVEALIPYDKSLLKSLNRAENVLLLKIPEGLLDVYLDTDED